MEKIKRKLNNKRSSLVLAFVCIEFLSLLAYLVVFANLVDVGQERARGMNLGSLSQDIDLKAPQGVRPSGSIESDSNGNPIAIYWTYKKTVKKIPVEDLERNERELVGFAEDYFTTLAGGGLGRPELVSVRNNTTGQTINPTTTTKNITDKNVEIMSSLKSKMNIASLTEGEYEFVVKTPIKEYRRYYVLDVNARLSSSFLSGQRVNVNGDYQVLTEDKTINSDGSIRGVVDSKKYSEFKYDDNYLHPNDVMDENSSYYVGSYLNSSDILWYASAINTYQQNETKSLNVTIDPTQETVDDDQVVSVFSPGVDGYDRVSRSTGGGNVITKDLKPSDIVLVRKKSWANNRYPDKEKSMHYFGDGEIKVSIEAFKGRVHITREWAPDVLEAKKTDSKFRISADGERNTDVIIRKSEREAWESSQVRNRFKEDLSIPSRGQWKYIDWKVEQIEIPQDIFVTTKMIDNNRLDYYFKDSMEKKSATGDDPAGGQVCEKYGVTEIGSDTGVKDENGVNRVDPNIYMNQYEYYRNPNNTSDKSHGQFFQGGSLFGRFRIPANAQYGDKFTLELPQQMIFNGKVYDREGYIGPIYATLGGNEKQIGKMYISHEIVPMPSKENKEWEKKVSTITFKLNSQAKWPYSYEGNFFIGNEKRGHDSYGSHAATYRIKSINNREIGDEEANKFVLQEGFVVGPDLVDPFDPYARQEVTKSLRWDANPKNDTSLKTKYYDSGGMVDYDCQNKKEYVETNIKGYFVNEYINKQNMLMRKFILEEGFDKETGKEYILYRVIYNGGILGEPLEIRERTSFFDYMPKGVQLLHGNNQEGINQDVKVWVSAFGNVAGTTNNGDPYLNIDAAGFPYDPKKSKAKVDARIVDIPEDYMSSALNLSAQIRDNDGNVIPMGNKLSFEVWSQEAYNNNNNNNAKGFVVIADIKMLRDRTFGGQFVNIASSQQAEWSGSPAKVRVLYYEPGYAGGSAESDKKVANLLFNKKIEDGGVLRNPREGEVFSFELSKVGDPTFTMTSKNRGEKVEFFDIPDGRYTLTEKISPARYAMSSSSISLEVRRGEITFDGRSYDFNSPPTVVNRKKPIFKITKRDKDTLALLNGYTVSLQKIDGAGNNIGEKIILGSRSENDPGSISVYPDASGLDFGTYRMIEEKAPEGYSKEKIDYGDGWLEDKVYYVRVNENGTISINDSGSLIGNFKPITSIDRSGAYEFFLDNKKNPPPMPIEKKVSLNLIKRDSKTQEPLAGASFTVFTDEGCTNVDTSVLINKDETEADGMLTISNLISGRTYYMKETQIPKSYSKDAANRVYKIVVDRNANIVVTSGATQLYRTGYDRILKIDNVKTTASFKVWKYVQREKEMPVEGAEFTLYQDASIQRVARINGKELKKTSDGGGGVIFDELPLSSVYYMKETKAPEGFIGSQDTYRVEVDASGRVSVYLANSNNKLGEDIALRNGSQNLILKVENKEKKALTTKVFIKKGDREQIRNRIDEIRYGSEALNEQREAFSGTSRDTFFASDFYPEYYNQDADSNMINDPIKYRENGITGNIDSLVATFEILQKNAEGKYEKITEVRTNETEKWEDNPIMSDNFNETGNDYASLELNVGSYIMREISQPNGYPASGKSPDIPIRIKNIGSEKYPNLAFVDPETGNIFNTNFGSGNIGVDGIYDAYYLQSYDFELPFDKDKRIVEQLSSSTKTILIANSKGSDLFVEKLTEDNKPFGGAKFKIDGGVVNTGRTGDSSKFDFHNITPGYHTLEEVKKPYLAQESVVTKKITFYKTDYGKIIIPAKRFTTKEEQEKIEQEVVNLWKDNRAELAVYRQLGKFDSEEMDNYYKLRDKIEDEIAAKYLDKEALDKLKIGQGNEALVSVKYAMENGKIKRDEKGDVSEATIVVKNLYKPVTSILIDSFPYILTSSLLVASGGFVLWKYLKRKKLKY